MTLPAIVAKQVVWHSIRRAFSVLCVFLVIGGLVWGVYVMAVKPHTNPTATQYQKAEKIENITHNYPDNNFFIGIKLFGFKFGVSK